VNRKFNITLDLNDTGSQYVNTDKTDSGEGPTVEFLREFSGSITEYLLIT
jgi:hypothetical protein